MKILYLINALAWTVMFIMVLHGYQLHQVEQGIACIYVVGCSIGFYLDSK